MTSSAIPANIRANVIYENDNGQHRAVIAVAAISLEQRLLCLLSANHYSFSRRRGLTQMIRELMKQQVLSSSEAERLTSVANLRNKAVHAAEFNPTKDDAEFVVDTIRAFLAKTTTEDCQ